MTSAVSKVQTDEQQEQVRYLGEARHSLRAYIEGVRGWRIRGHQESWVLALQLLLDGLLTDHQGNPTNRLIIIGPRGSGKTEIASQTVEWAIGRALLQGRAPHIGYIGYADEKVAAVSKAIRNFIAGSRIYQELLFPNGSRPCPEMGWGEHAWWLAKGNEDKDPTMRACGVGSGIIGFRLDEMLVMDDLLTQAVAESTVERERVWRYVQDSVYPATVIGQTPTVMICTRFDEDDPVGRALGTESGWRLVHTKALQEDDGGLRSSYWDRERCQEDGQWRGITVEQLEKIEAEHPRSYLTQWQGLPPKAVSNSFEFTPMSHPDPSQVVGSYGCWDTAYKVGRQNDFSATVEAVRMADRRLCIVGCHQRRMAMPELEETVKQRRLILQEEWQKPVTLLIEDKASGPTLAQLLHIKPKSVQNKDLVYRFARACHYFHTGQIGISTRSWPMKEGMLDQLRTFPGGGHDDYLAALCLLVEQAFGQYMGAMPRMEVEHGRY